MNRKRFGSLSVEKIILDFDKFVKTKTNSKEKPSETYTAVEILRWYIQVKKVTLRKKQLFPLWKKIARATAGPGYVDKGEYPKHFQKANEILFKSTSRPFAFR